MRPMTPATPMAAETVTRPAPLELELVLAAELLAVELPEGALEPELPVLPEVEEPVLPEEPLDEPPEDELPLDPPPSLTVVLAQLVEVPAMIVNESE